MERILRISPNGDTVTMVYGEGAETFLGSLGIPQMVRASHVKFDNDTLLWHIYMLFPRQTEIKLPGGFKTRKEAIEVEIRLCEAILVNKGTGKIQELLMEAGWDQEGHRVSG